MPTAFYIYLRLIVLMYKMLWNKLMTIGKPEQRKLSVSSEKQKGESDHTPGFCFSFSLRSKCIVTNLLIIIWMASFWYYLRCINIILWCADGIEHCIGLVTVESQFWQCVGSLWCQGLSIVVCIMKYMVLVLWSVLCLIFLGNELSS